MEVAMDGMMELEILSFSSTNSIPINVDIDWRNWSPEINWDQFTDTDDFHGLIDSMIPDAVELHDFSASVSPTSTNCPGTPVGVGDLIPPDNNDTALRLVHLLMAAAESLTVKSPDLAEVVLARLRELLRGGGASSMERLAAHFTDALHYLLNVPGDSEPRPPQPIEFLEAFQLMQDMSPYVKFGYFTANQAILEAVAGERRVHVVDYDVQLGAQWASMMQAMVSTNNGSSPPPHLRVTAVTHNRRSMQETGRRLAAYAASLGLPFSFMQCRMDDNDQFRPSAIKLNKGEAVAFNCVINPCTAAGAFSFIAGAAAVGARVVTVVEEEREGVGFEGRFKEEMVRYSAIWDAIEAGFEKQGRAREMVERVILGPRIVEAVAMAYRGMDASGKLGARLAAAGFRKKGLSFFNVCQARLLLGLFNDGYRVEGDGTNKLVLCWQTCRLISASVWAVPATPAASPAGSLV